jgi:hypothetical protein
MATTLHRVWQNFIWRIGSLTPTCTRGTLRQKFVHLNGVQPGQAPGTSRGFEVALLRGGTSGEPTNFHARRGIHQFLVEVFYDKTLKPDARHEVILQDRHDITTELRRPGGWVGYDATHTTDSIMLSRENVDDEYEIVETESNIVLRMPFQVRAREVENA